MFSRILSNTPIWVWGLLLALLALGFSQTRARLVGLPRILILPLVMTGMAVSGVVSSFGVASWVLLIWSAAASLAAGWVLRRPMPPLTRYDSATGLYCLPGSWLPMALILGIFIVKYAVGVSLAMQPALASNTGFCATIGIMYGLFSGVFIARAGRLWLLAKSPSRVSVAAVAPTARSPLQYFLRIVLGVSVAFIGVVAGLIVFGASSPPPPLPAVAGAVMNADYRRLPLLMYFTARDGQALAYRAYAAGNGERVAVLIHGSSADSRAMQAVGMALANSGVTAYALDMRGHGASGRRGDIDYIGQLDDDLADFVSRLRSAHPQAQLSLIGHSSGGGFALRTAGGPNGALFDRYVLLAPFLHSAAPTTRPNAGGWVQPFIPRMIGLGILDGLGLPWFQHLPVLAFALPPEAASKTTATYSYRLQLSFRPHQDYLADVRRIARPTRLLVGANDELFIADQYAPLLEPVQPRLTVKQLPEISHIDIVVKPAALVAIVAEL